METEAPVIETKVGLNAEKPLTIKHVSSGEPEKDITPEVKKEEPKVEMPVVQTEKQAEVIPEVAAEVKPEGSLKTPIVEKAEEVPVKSFEDYLAEKSEGKFKNWDEIAEQLNAPKEEFADEYVKQINQYVKDGGKFDDNWLRIQSTDYTAITDPIQLIAEQRKLEEPGITDEELKYEMDERYKINEWANEGEDATEIEKVMVQKMQREAEKSRQWLIENKKKIALSPKQQNAEQEAIQQDANKKVTEDWNKAVDTTVKTITKVSIKLSETEGFDYPVTADDVKDANKIVKQMLTNGNALATEHLDAKQPFGVNIKSLSEMVLKTRVFDKAVKFAIEQGKVLGASTTVKDIKNVNFTPDGKTIPPTEVKSVAQQIGSQIATQLKN